RSAPPPRGERRGSPRTDRPSGSRCRWMRSASVEPRTLPTGIIGRDPDVSIIPMARGRHTHRRRVGAITTIVVAVAGVVLLAFGGVAYAAYRYEMGHADRILPGVTIAGVDVGGMTRAEATQKVGALVRNDLRGQIRVAGRAAIRSGSRPRGPRRRGRCRRAPHPGRAAEGHGWNPRSDHRRARRSERARSL